MFPLVLFVSILPSLSYVYCTVILGYSISVIFPSLSYVYSQALKLLLFDVSLSTLWVSLPSVSVSVFVYSVPFMSNVQVFPVASLVIEVAAYVRPFCLGSTYCAKPCSYVLVVTSSLFTVSVVVLPWLRQGNVPCLSPKMHYFFIMKITIILKLCIDPVCAWLIIINNFVFIFQRNNINAFTIFHWDN